MRCFWFLLRGDGINSELQSSLPSHRAFTSTGSFPQHLTEDAYEPPDEEDTDAEDDDDHEDDEDEDPDVGVGSYQRVGGGHTDPPSEPEYDAETQAAVDGEQVGSATEKGSDRMKPRHI